MMQALTERELAVLNLLKSGASFNEVGGRLYWSDTTMGNIVGALRRKLEARNVAHAVYLAIKRGIIE